MFCSSSGYKRILLHFVRVLKRKAFARFRCWSLQIPTENTKIVSEIDTRCDLKDGLLYKNVILQIKSIVCLAMLSF